MARRATASQSSSSSQYIDSSFHPGFVNLGNTCFLNSVLQAASATQSLKQLYHPDDFILDESTSDLVRGRAIHNTDGGLVSAAELSDDSAFAHLVEQLSARSKSPVLQLVDEEKGRLKSYPASRRASTIAEHSNTSSLLARSEEATIDSTIHSTRSSIDIKGYEPSPTDLPLNTAFRHILEKTWTSSEEKKIASTSKTSQRNKAASVNPKRLLNIMASKYDQYGDYAQQDGHELLRHLLDSLRMEELDVIKKIRPPSPKNQKKRNRAHSTAIEVKKSKEETLQPFVDNLFCGKLLSCVVCEGCRHVSHTYEDFYDISLSLRSDSEAKSAIKRDRMKSMADRWKRATTSKNAGNGSSNRSKLDSVTSLRDDLVGSMSDTEEVDQRLSHSAKFAGAGIVRPKSAAAGQNPAVVDANSKASAKTFMMKSLQPEAGQSIVADMEKVSLQADEKKGGAVALLRAVSTRSRSKTRGAPSSRGPSPIKEEINQLVDAEREANRASQPHHHHHLLRHEHKPKQSKHSAYLAKLLQEAPLQPTLAPASALLWGRKTPVTVSNDHIAESNQRKAFEQVDIESQQASTGLVRALHQFTAVEVLDGPNSFACKRCWRLLNPPSVEEKQRLRSRRLRRGKDADESERSSDDDPSSGEEGKEQSGQSEIASLSPRSFTESKPSRPAVNPHADWNKTVTPHSIDRQHSIPTIETSTSNDDDDNDDDDGGKMGDKRDDTPPSKREPLLKAPKAITASSKGLTLGESLSSASSDEDLSDVGEDGNKRAPSVTFEEQQNKRAGSRTSLPMAIQKPNPVIGKRSTHSLQRRALKRFLIANTPRVLVFHFKRFQANSRGFSSYSFNSSFKKIDDYVSFPEILDVKPWLAPPREEYSQNGHLKKSSDVRALTKAQSEENHEPERGHGKWGWKHWHTTKEETEAEQLVEADTKTKYKLYAVVVHQGSMNGGHYTAYVLSDRINEAASKSKAILETVSNTPTANTTPCTTPGSSEKKSLPYLSKPGDSQKNLSTDASLRTSHSLTSLSSSNGGGACNGNSSEAVNSTSSIPSSSEQLSRVSEPNTKQSSIPTAAAAASMMPSTSSNGTAHSSMSSKKQDTRRWIFCSDTVIRGATIEEVLKSQAYMTFYEQM